MKQWLSDWDGYEFEETAQRRKPEPYIYLFSMPANQLRKLSDVYRREREVEATEGIQRARDDNRTSRIRRYIKYGYPFGDLRADQQNEENLSLRKPGWLPTAIVVNVLTSQDRARRGRKIKPAHQASFSQSKGGAFELNTPSEDIFEDGDVRPFEVIDGQHRLWAFDETDDLPGDFELPVVAFVGLDIAWQAYLFWSINVSPKRINPSHAFDLYPLLRTQDWLEKTGEIAVYREARAQELVEWLYKHPKSVWVGKINMLGQKGEGRVSQAAWIRSILASYLGTGRGKGRHGLFHAPVHNEEPLGWSRPQQVAFIMLFWEYLAEEIRQQVPDWAEHYINEERDPLFDRSSMLNQDMGVRAVNAAVNDLFLNAALSGEISDWHFNADNDTDTSAEDITRALRSLRVKPLAGLLRSVAQTLARFDWRSVDGPYVKGTDAEILKRAFRGSGGYTLLVRNLLSHLVTEGDGQVAHLAEAASEGDVE
ncbi:MAG: hypothetical protein C0456_10705 [Hyphomonas sp.]|nr:hypothetical protein [Hyphomonas sp.]